MVQSRMAKTRRFPEPVWNETFPFPGSHRAWHWPGNTKCDKTLADFISLNPTALFKGRRMSAFPPHFNSLPVDPIPSYHKEIIVSCCVINTHVWCGKHFPVDCLFLPVNYRKSYTIHLGALQLEIRIQTIPTSSCLASLPVKFQNFLFVWMCNKFWQWWTCSPLFI